MNARERILRRLQKEKRPAQLPERWVSQPVFTDLAAQFEAALTAVKGEVLWAADLPQAQEYLKQIIQEIGAGRVVANLEEPIDQIEAASAFPGVMWQVPGMEPGGWRAACASADLGVTGADLVLAETGSVVVGTGTGKSRLVSLLPPVHVVLVPKARLVADLFAWKRPKIDEFPSQIVWISGPSKTADIEQTLVVGVHGPKRLIVILYDDSPRN